MSTKACAFKQNPDGSLIGIYIHYDGYPDDVGRLLRECYSKPEQIDALLALGALSSLDRSIEAPEGHSFRSPAPGCSIAYHRDRGDKLEIIRRLNLSDAFLSCGDIDYIYLWADPATGWQCVGRFGKRQDVHIPGGAR